MSARRFPGIVVLLGIAALAIAALPAAPAHADMLPYGGSRPRPPLPPPPPPPRPLTVLFPVFVEKIRAGGFDCAQIDAAQPRVPAGVDPSTSDGKDPQQYTVTCAGGRRYLVTLSTDADKSRDAVLPLD